MTKSTVYPPQPTEVTIKFHSAPQPAHWMVNVLKTRGCGSDGHMTQSHYLIFLFLSGIVPFEVMKGGGEKKDPRQ